MNDEKAIEQLEEFLVIDDWSAVYMPYLQDAIEYVINRIKALEERPQGEWKLIRVADPCGIHDSFVCPFCNYEKEYRKKNFCEECGADLRGKQK